MGGPFLSNMCEFAQFKHDHSSVCNHANFFEFKKLFVKFKDISN